MTLILDDSGPANSVRAATYETSNQNRQGQLGDNETHVVRMDSSPRDETIERPILVAHGGEVEARRERKL